MGVCEGRRKQLLNKFKEITGHKKLKEEGSHSVENFCYDKSGSGEIINSDLSSTSSKLRKHRDKNAVPSREFIAESRNIGYGKPKFKHADKKNDAHSVLSQSLYALWANTKL